MNENLEFAKQGIILNIVLIVIGIILLLTVGKIGLFMLGFGLGGAATAGDAYRRFNLKIVKVPYDINANDLRVPAGEEVKIKVQQNSGGIILVTKTNKFLGQFESITEARNDGWEI